MSDPNLQPGVTQDMIDDYWDDKTTGTARSTPYPEDPSCPQCGRKFTTCACGDDIEF